MGRTVKLSSTEDIKTVLEYFDALGFKRLPLEVPGPRHLGPEEKARALEALRQEMGNCQRCKLGHDRKNLVFGEGNPDAELMFIGEAPGREEDLKGRPFVGEAGQLLTRLINKMGFKREDVYIANIIKSRPPGNRDPDADEINACMPFLKKQIEIIAPEVIISLGRISSHTLTGLNTPISRLRGTFHEFQGIPLMPTFHPAYLLRNPKGKHQVWSDAQQVLGLLGRSVS